jgi:hypothetical protein
MTKAWWISFVLVFTTGTSFADERLELLAKHLVTEKDPRIRAQSALLLGTLGNAASAEHLCSALQDHDFLVRMSATKALEKLAVPKGFQCLLENLEKASPDLQKEIHHILSTTRARSVPYFVLKFISKSVDASVGQFAEQELSKALLIKGMVSSSSQASPEFEGFELLVVLQGFSNGALSMSILCSTYPKRVLQGETHVKASGSKPESLLRALIPKLVENADRQFNWSTPR